MFIGLWVSKSAAPGPLLCFLPATGTSVSHSSCELLAQLLCKDSLRSFRCRRETVVCVVGRLHKDPSKRPLAEELLLQGILQKGHTTGDKSSVQHHFPNHGCES